MPIPDHGQPPGFGREDVAFTGRSGSSNRVSQLLAGWAQSLTGQTAARSRGRLRFAFYGRVSTEDWQDPGSSRARQLRQAVMLVEGRA